MRFAVIVGPSFKEAKSQIARAKFHVDGIELCFEQLDTLSLEQLSSLCDSHTLKKIAKLEYPVPDTLINNVLSLSFDYIDITYPGASHTLEKLRKQTSNINFLLSYHNFSFTPKRLESIFHSMSLFSPDIFKIATMAVNDKDNDLMLDFVEEKTALGYRMIGICMGEKGKKTRLEGRKKGNVFEYIAVDAASQSAPGQLHL